ncbi:MAG: aspartate/glutamate racemase family protein [Ardenticatenaceae bacterium]|nr:aspartate/glutamate racemase family protein [Ardenticatenaceae bacterium]
MSEKIIGIVAGVGPFAGLDLLRKILDQTVASKDQEHLTVASLSQPNEIADRTEYLLGEVAENPAQAFVRQLLKLEQMGAQVGGIPCNTAHAPAIFGEIVAGLKKGGSGLHLLHMIEETAVHLHHAHPQLQNIGILSTTGTYLTQIYPEALARFGLTAVVPTRQMQEEIVHTAVYAPDYGLKACGVATKEAREGLTTAVRSLQTQGAEAIILGCTEMPLAITEPTLYGLPIIDPTLILARALIREANPAKLKP